MGAFATVIKALTLKKIRKNIIKAERRFYGHNSDMIDGYVEVVMTNTQMISTLLDIRTVHCRRISKEQHTKSIQIYQPEYIKYYHQHIWYDEQEHAREKNHQVCFS